MLQGLWKKMFSLLDRTLPGQTPLRYFIRKHLDEIGAVNPVGNPVLGVVYHCAAFDPQAFSNFRKCLERQSYRNFTVVIADDSMTRETLSGVDYLCFVEQGDLMHEHALAILADEVSRHDYDLIYTDEDEQFLGIFRRKPFFKPGYGKYLLWSTDYVSSFLCVKALPATVDRLVAGGVSRDTLYALALDVDAGVRKVARVPKVLYHRGSSSVRAQRRSREVLEEFLEQRNLLGRVTVADAGDWHRLSFRPSSRPLVSIVIPFKDKVALTETCVRSIERSTYRNFEIILVDNRSVEDDTVRYLEQTPHTVIRADFDFNYSRLNNVGVAAARGDYLVMMNNDMEVITPDWLENLIGLAEFADVGAVAPKLLYPDGTVQHAGMVLLGKKGPKHVNRNLRGDKGGYGNFNNLVREYLAFTGACIAVSKDKFLEVGGFAEELAIISNDVDLCLKLYERGYVNVYTPEARLFHYESASRKGQKKGVRGDNLRLFGERWGKYFGNDPYYNPNLTQQRKDFAVRADVREP
jgi:GT2 family glycosyltransferase